MNMSEFELLNIVKYDYDLSVVSSMKTGGRAKFAFFPETEKQLSDVIEYLRENGVCFYVIGFASNVLFPDAFFDGAIVFTTNLKFFKIDFAENGDVLIYAQAGVSLTSLAARCIKENYSGLEFAYGIPGTVGGAIFMNAGAYGGEIADVVVSSKYYDSEKGKFFELEARQNEFSYRHSYYTDNPDKIIVGGTFRVKKSEGTEVRRLSEENMEKRKSKQPLDYPNCGSAFKRPQGCFAGTLIEGAGLKGKNVGGAYVSEKHAGFIINKGGAATSDVLELIKLVQKKVYEKYAVALEPEIRIIEW